MKIVVSSFLMLFLWANILNNKSLYFLFLLRRVDAQEVNIIQTTATLSQARVDLTAASSGEIILFGGGGTSMTTPSGRVDICNVTSGIWTTATLSVPRGILAATSSGNLVFFAGGADSLGAMHVYNTVDIYNVSDGSWSTATLSQARFGVAATSVRDVVLFGGGGSNVTEVPTVLVDVYNMTTNTWTNATLSQPRYLIAAAAVANRYALFAGGHNKTNGGETNIVDIYDSLSGVWSTSTLSQPRYSLAAASIGTLAFFGGGNTTNNKPSNVVDIFNSTSLTWSTATLSSPRFLLAAASVGEIVAFGGGSPDGFTTTAIVDMYNVTSGSWFLGTLSQPRAGLAATSSNNKIFFGGGLSNTGISDVVDIFDFNPTSTTVPSNLPTSTGPSKALSPSVVAGVVVGVVAAMLIVAGTVIFIVLLNKRRKQQLKSKYSTNMPQQEEMKTSRLTSERVSDSKIKRYSQIHFNEFVIEKEIGEGSYGKVCLGMWNNGVVAIKFCRNKGKIEDFMIECKIMTELPPHPNVVQVFGVSLDGPQPAIIMEYCAGGSLDKILFDSKVKLNEEYKIQLVRKIAGGMCHLHKHNIVHRDLAARNILLTSEGDPKISDFGMSRFLQETEGQTASNFGPIRWMAPESIGQHKYSKQSDVWMFGIVVWEIVAQCEPHVDVDPVDVGALIRDQGLTPKIPDDCPHLLRELMQICWKKDPNERPRFDMISTLLSYCNKDVAIAM